MAINERWRACSGQMRFRYGAGQVGVGLGFLIVVAAMERDLGSPFARGFGRVGLISLILGLGLMMASWIKTKPI